MGAKAQKTRFKNNKKLPPGIHPIYKCAKFKHNWVIFDFPRLPKLLGKNGSQGPKKGRFSKNERC